MSFAQPWNFLWLLLVPFIVWAYCRRRRPALGFSSIVAFGRLRTGRFSWIRHAFLWSRCAAIVCLVAALARPQWLSTSGKRSQNGLDIVLAIDTSGSMRSMDFLVNGQRQSRLDVVKSVIAAFIAHRPDDRLGMVVFGTHAFTQAPLTLDHDVLNEFLGNIAIGMAGEETAIGDALATAAKRLKDLKAKSKVVILLTDGGNDAGKIDPVAAADAAKTLGIKIYTIGVGSKGKVPVPVDDVFGTHFVYQESDLDEGLLKRIAGLTGGRYFRATDTESLEKIYQTIDQLEKTRVDTRDFGTYEEACGLFLWPALAWLGLEVVLGATRWRRLPA